MRCVTSKLLALACCCVALPCVAAEPAWTLRDAYRSAIAHHPSVVQALAKVESARAQIGVARNAWLPTATVDVNHQESTSNPPGASSSSFVPNPSWQGSVQGRWVAWDFGKTTANIAAAEANANVAGEDLKAARGQLWLALAQAWVAVQAADANLAVYRATLQQLERQRDAVKQQVALRARPELDLFKAEADVAAAQGDVLRAEEVVRSQRLALAVAVAEPKIPSAALAPLEVDLPGVPTATLDDESRLDELVAMAVQARPEFASLRARLDALHKLELAAQRAVRPNVYVAGQTNVAGTDLTGLALNYGLTIGLQFPLSTVWTQPPLIADAGAQIRALAASQDAQVLQLRGAINQAITAVVQARKRGPVVAAQRNFAEKALDAATVRYKAGAGLWLDVADAETGVLRARLAVVQNGLDVDGALAQLAYLLMPPPEPLRGE